MPKENQNQNEMSKTNPGKVKKLVCLTDEHRAAMAPHAQSWIKKSMRLGPATEADWDQFERGTKAAYGFASLPWHGVITRVANPIVAALTAAYCNVILAEDSPRNLRATLLPKALPTNAEMLWALGYDRRQVFGERQGGKVPEQKESVYKAVLCTLAHALYGDTPPPTNNPPQKRATTKKSPQAQSNDFRKAFEETVKSIMQDISKRGTLRSNTVSYLGGTMWLGWPATLAFYRDVVNLELPDEIYARAQACEDMRVSTSYCWPHTQFVIACDLPRAIQIEQIADSGFGSHRLNCLEGPALGWDGFEIFAIEGVEVEPHVVLEPGKITLAEIAAEGNAEVKRILRQQYGEGRYLTDSGATVVDMDYEGCKQGSAPRVLLRDSDGNHTLVGTDGSTGRVYYMRVDPQIKTCKKAHESLAGFAEVKIKYKS